MWSAITDVGSYRTWWPWLADLDADGFTVGTTWRCSVQPPLPYRVRFRLTLDVIEPEELVAATVEGDIVGTARLVLQGADGGGTDVRLVSALAPANPILRRIARLAAPIARFGHDWVLDTGASQFRRSALHPDAG